MFEVQSSGTSLLELLPDPLVDRYKIKALAQLKDLQPPGEFGLYFGRIIHEEDDADDRVIVFKMRLNINTKDFIGFNNYIKTNSNDEPKLKQISVILSSMGSKQGPKKLNKIVTAISSINIKELKYPNFNKYFNHQWCSLEIDVSPKLVQAKWNGLPIGMTAGQIDRAVEEYMLKYRYERHGPYALDHPPRFTPRGGLGLYIRNCTVVFREVSVTPL